MNAKTALGFRAFGAGGQRRVAILSLLLLLGSPGVGRSELVDWLYQVQVPVVDQGQGTRAAAARDALRVVLTRISGVADLPLDPILSAAERAPGRYYSSFQYLQPAAGGELAVRFEFVPALTLKLSKALQLPVWWQNRPRVVPWLSLDGQQLVLASPQDPPQVEAPAAVDTLADPTVELAQAMERRARERGLPLQLPTVNADGLEPFAPQRIASAATLDLLAASTGLNPEWIGQGRVEQRAGSYRAALRFAPALMAPTETLDRGLDVAFNVQAATPTDLGIQLIDQLSDALAQRFAASGGGALTLRVLGVDGPQPLVDLLRYLRQLSFLDGVQIVESGPEGLLLQLDSQADFEQLQTLLAVESRLQPELTEGSALAFGPPIFRWQG